MNEPRRHHFIPRFYLKQWQSADTRVCEYRRVHTGKVVTKRRYTKETGAAPDLYRCDGLPLDLAQKVESVFMSTLDAGANAALSKILSGDNSPWQKDMQIAWARFVLSLRFRTPQRVREIRDNMLEVWLAGASELQNNYTARRLETDPETFEEYMQMVEPSAPYKAALHMLQELISSPTIVSCIANMNWCRIDLSESQVPLVTSDRPLDMPYALERDEAFIALPVGPYTLFIASHTDQWGLKASTTDPTKLATLMNLAVVGQARELVWGVDDRHLHFVRHNISSGDERPLLTEAQKQAAIAAARGA